MFSGRKDDPKSEAERKRLSKGLPELHLQEKECDDEIEKIEKYQADFLSRYPRPRDALGPEISSPINRFFWATQNEIKYWRHQADKKGYWLSKRDQIRQQIRELEQEAATRGISYQELRDGDTPASPDTGEQSRKIAVPTSEKKSKPQSELYQEVVRYLMAHPKAKAKDVCAWLDQKTIKGLEGWYPDGKERALSQIYGRFPVIRKRIDTFVTKRRREAEARLLELKKPL